VAHRREREIRRRVREMMSKQAHGASLSTSCGICFISIQAPTNGTKVGAPTARPRWRAAT